MNLMFINITSSIIISTLLMKSILTTMSSTTRLRSRKSFFNLVKSSSTRTFSVIANNDCGSKHPSKIAKASQIIENFLFKSDFPNLQDIKVIEQRQLGHKVTGIFAVESARCKYGFPRAYVV